MPALPLLVPAAGCNCDVCPYYKGDPDRGVPPGPAPICSGSNPSCRFCGCSVGEAAAARPAGTGPCGACPVRCGSRPDMASWVASAGGTLEFDDLPFAPPAPPPLPRIIPLTDNRNLDSLHAAASWPAWGVPLRRVLTRSPGTEGPLALQPRWHRDGAHATLGLDRTRQRAVLVGYAPDQLLERLWERRHTDGLIDQLAACRFDLVTAPDFSVYADQPRAEQLFNMRRSLTFASELAEAGVPAAPAIYGGRREDLDRWVAWIDEVHPPAIFLPRHTLRLDRDWDLHAVPALSYLAAQLHDLAADGGPAPTVLVSGVADRRRLAQLAAWFGQQLHVATQAPVQTATHGRALTMTGREPVHAHHSDLAGHNLRLLDRYLNVAINTARTKENCA